MQTPLLKIRRRFSRWRHGRGFGIHSPFAYRFVTEVLRQRCAYYAYGELGSDKLMKLVVRLVVALQPSEVIVAAIDSSYFRKALRLADSRIPVRELSELHDGTFKPDTLLIAFADYLPADEIDALLQRSPRPHALLIGTTRRPALEKFGMTFRNAVGTVVVASYPHLPRQDFEVKF